jgi:hypothetical protein
MTPYNIIIFLLVVFFIFVFGCIVWIFVNTSILKSRKQERADRMQEDRKRIKEELECFFINSPEMLARLRASFGDLAIASILWSFQEGRQIQGLDPLPCACDEKDQVLKDLDGLTLYLNGVLELEAEMRFLRAELAAVLSRRKIYLGVNESLEFLMFRPVEDTTKMDAAC